MSIYYQDMIIYIQHSRRADILCTVSHSDLPVHIQERVEKERAAEELRQQELREAQLYMLLKIATVTELSHHCITHKLDLMNFDDAIQLRVLKTSTLLQLKVSMALQY